MHAVGSVSVCYSLAFLWTAGIKQQLFVSHAGILCLTRMFFKKGEGKNVTSQDYFSSPVYVVTALLGDPVQ